MFIEVGHEHMYAYVTLKVRYNTKLTLMWLNYTE